LIDYKVNKIIGYTTYLQKGGMINCHSKSHKKTSFEYTNEALLKF